jgi:ATP-binding cassette subfamily B protein
LGGFFVLVTNTSEILIPKFIQWSFDFLSFPERHGVIPSFFRQESHLSTLNTMVVSMALVLLVALIGRFGWRQTLARQSHRAGYDLKNEFWDVIRFQNVSLLQRYPLGDLMNRAIADWKNTRFIHGFTLVATFDVVFFTILAVVSMLKISVTLTILCLLIVPFLPRPVAKLTRKEGRLHSDAQQTLSHLSETIAQSISTIRLQRATASEKIWLTKLEDEARHYAEQKYQVIKTEWQIFPLGALPTLFAYGLLLTYGTTLIMKGDLTVGEFVALQSYVFLLQSPLFEVGAVIAEWQTGFVSYERLAEVFKLRKGKESAQTSPEPHTSRNYAIEISNLDVKYEGSDHWVFKGINLAIKDGEFIGIIGPIGAGKSSLLKAISGLLDHYRGRIQIGGVPLEDIPRARLHQDLLLVSQRPFLFSGTVRYNLSLGGEFTDAELWQALKIAHLDKDIAALGGKLDSWIGEWGINLSGGQKQRLSLARAILRKPRILLFDDCLSAVDAITEESMLDLLTEHFQGHTVIWVAHRMSTLKKCNKIYALEHGKLNLVSDEI